MLHSLANTLSKPVIGLEAKFPRVIGYIWGIASMCCLSTSSFFVKKVSKDVPAVQTFFARSIIILVLCYFLMKAQKMQFYYKSVTINRLLLVRGIVGGSGMMLIYYGLRLLPLSDATVLTQIYPIFTGILASLFLGEKYHLTQLGSALICIVGVVFIAQPVSIFGSNISNDPYIENRLFGTIILVFASTSTAIVEVIIRKIGVKTNIGIVTFIAAIESTIIGAIICIFYNFVSVSWEDAHYILWVGLLSFGSQVLRGRALVLVDAGKLANTAYFGVLNAYILDIFVIGTQLNFYSLSGAICIFLCLVIYMYRIYKK